MSEKKAVELKDLEIVKKYVDDECAGIKESYYKKTDTVVNATNASYATSAGSAVKATQDSDGKIIKDTYYKKTDTVANATNASNATTAANATYATSAGSAVKATQDSDGKVIKDTYLKKTDSITNVAYATNAGSATKATQDSDGKVIKDTYLKKTDTVTNASYATNAGNALSATKATQDSDGKVIKDTYYKKTDTVANATKATQDGDGNVISETYMKFEDSGTPRRKTLTTGVVSGSGSATVYLHGDFSNFDHYHNRRFDVCVEVLQLSSSGYYEDRLFLDIVPCYFRKVNVGGESLSIVTKHSLLNAYYDMESESGYWRFYIFTITPGDFSSAYNASAKEWKLSMSVEEIKINLKTGDVTRNTNVDFRIKKVVELNERVDYITNESGNRVYDEY